MIPGDDVDLNPLETMVEANYHPRIYENDVKYVDMLDTQWLENWMEKHPTWNIKL